MAKLNAYQQALAKLGNNATPEQKRALNLQFFGEIDKSKIPPGSQILEDVPGEKVTYKDPEGYVHTLQRQFDARLESLGQVKEETNRPAVVLPKESNNLIDTLIQQVQGNVGKTPSLGELDDQTLAALDSITRATQMAVDQRFQDQAGSLIASLYGRGVNQSSLANDAAARFLQDQGLVNAQVGADAGARQIDVGKFLATLGQNQSQIDANTLNQLLGISTQAQTASANNNIQQQQTDNAMQQFLQNYRLQRDQYEYQTNKSNLGSILGGLASTALGIATGGASVPFTAGLSKILGGGTKGIVDSPISIPGITNNQNVYA